jgi:hypothetical protein
MNSPVDMRPAAAGEAPAAGPPRARTPGGLDARRWAALAGLLAGYYAVAVAIYRHWADRAWFPVSGDEPHYLTIAYSLAYDHTANLYRAYAHAFATPTVFHLPFGPGTAPNKVTAHATPGPHGLFSTHGLGLPALLVPGFRLDSVDGAKLTMVAISGLAVALAGYLALRSVRSTAAAVAIAAAAAIGMPLLASASQIYPDVPAGTISLAVLTAVYLRTRPAGEATAGDPGRPPLAIDVILMAALALQPWLEIKNVAPALLGAAGLAWAYRRTGQHRRAVAVAVVTVVSVVALAAYEEYAFGSLTGSYSSANSLSAPGHAAMVFLGLHLDAQQGILVQAPILVFGLAGIVRGLRRRQGWALLATGLYLSVMIPNAVYPNTYGGGAFAGRFGWSGAVLLLLPTVGLLAELWEQRRVLLVSIAVAGELAIQAVAAVRYGVDHLVLYSEISSGASVAWAGVYPIVWGPAVRILPAYYDDSWAWRYLPNLLAPLVVVLGVAWLSGLGLRRRHGRRGRPWVPAAATAAAIVAYLLVAAIPAPPEPPLTVPAATLPRLTGQQVGNGVEASATDPAGFVTFGPPFFAGPGRYRFEIVASATAATAPPGAAPGSWDVVASVSGNGLLGEGADELATGPIPPTGGRTTTVAGTFTIPSSARTWAVQIRTRYAGSGTLTIASITLARP